MSDEKITSLEQADWEIRGIKERLKDGNALHSKMNAEIGTLRQVLEDQNKVALREHAAANKSDNERLAAEVKERLSELKVAIAEDIGEIRPARITWLKILGLVAALGIPTMGLVTEVIWTASKYPDRSEFQVLVDRFSALELDRAKRIAGAPSTFATRPEFDDVLHRLAAIELELAKRKAP